MLDTAIQVKTDTFDGPLGLLLLLVQKEEMKIRDLDLTSITKQYLDYLSKMEKLNFDVAGDYLYLAATLLLIKSNNCLTEEENENLKNQFDSEKDLAIRTEADLIQRLEELEKFQRLGQKLWKMDKLGHEIFVRPKINRKKIADSILSPMDLQKLIDSMMHLILKERRKYTVLRRDRLSIREKLQFLKDTLAVGTKTNLRELIEQNGEQGLENTVITFISLLELARLKRIQLFQNKSLGNIYVEVVKDLQDFDVNQADGFDAEDEDSSEADLAPATDVKVEVEATHTTEAPVQEEGVIQ